MTKITSIVILTLKFCPTYLFTQLPNDESTQIPTVASSVRAVDWKQKLDRSWLFRACLVAQTVKNLTVMRETQVQSLSQEYRLEEEMATPSSIFVWEIPWTEEPGRLQSMGSQRVRRY